MDGRWMLLPLAIAMGAPAAAFAQTNSVPGASEGGDSVADLVVTARKRPERLQDTPISITAFDAQALARAGIRDIGDLSRSTPGMQYGNFGDLKLSPTSLRGVVSGAGSAGAEPAVAYYVDEVYMGQGAGANLDLYDIERVEVLRGPQGALFGRNSIGGLISLTTKAPTDRFAMSGEIGAGNYSQFRAAGSLSGPLIGERVLAKLSVIRSQRAGYEYNEVLSHRVNDAGSTTARGQILVKVGAVSKLTLTGAYHRVKQHPLVFETLSYNPNAVVAQLYTAAGMKPNGDPYDRRVQADSPSLETLKAYDASARFTTRIGKVGLTALSAYHKHNYFSRTDTDRSPFSLLYDGDPERVTRWSHEVRADVTLGNLDLLIGGYRFTQNASNLSFVEVGKDLGALFGSPALGGTRAGSDAALRTVSNAVFGNATWKISQAAELTVGGRYTHDAKRIDYHQQDALGLLGGNFAVAAHDAWSQFTPSASFRYRFTPNLMGYLTVSRGFKSGGFNDALGDANGIGFGPETMMNYEAGTKGSLANGRLTFALSVFHMRWRDIQITTDNPATAIYDPIIRNAGAAHSNGVEGEVTAHLSRAWDIGANFSVQSARYDAGALPSPPGTPALPLRRTLYSPAQTASGNVTYRHPTPLGEVELFAETTWRGVSYLDYANSSDGRVAPYALVNARASLHFRKDHFRISAWIRNISNIKRAQRLFDLYSQSIVGQKFIVLNDPRTVGVELRVSY